MDKIYYNKLCRDNVPEIVAAKGFTCEVREVDHAEYRREIVRKVYEEASGVSNHQTREELMKELADLVITLDALSKEYDISNEELDAAVGESLKEKGGYHKRLYIAWSSDTEYNSHDKQHPVDD